MKQILSALLVSLILLLTCYGYFRINPPIKLAKRTYELQCYNDSTPAFVNKNEYISIFDARLDSLKFAASNNSATYHIEYNKNKAGFPRYYLYQTSKTFNHRIPTYEGFLNFLKQ